VHSQTARGFRVEALVFEEACGDEALGALLGFPVAVGFTDGTKTSKPNPKNIDCIITKSLALIFTLTLFESANYTS
jgi:hypothetical protein